MLSSKNYMRSGRLLSGEFESYIFVYVISGNLLAEVNGFVGILHVEVIVG